MKKKLNDQTIRILIEYVDYVRKYHEKIEEYEICKEMKEFAEKLGDYVLGYITYFDIEKDLYNFCLCDADLKAVDEYTRSACFELEATGQKFVFNNLSMAEMNKLKMMLVVEKQEKPKEIN